MEAERRRYLGLDLIRLFAASLVVVYHYRTAFADMRFPLSWAGWIGVEVFFVLSGLVISFTAEGSTASEFAEARAARLLPGAWICGTGTMILLCLDGQSASLINAYIRTILLWPTGPWVDGVYWTIPIEIIFYIFVFTTLGKNRLINFNGLVKLLTIGGFLWSAGSFSVSLQLFPAIDGILVQIIPPLLISLLQFGCFFSLGALIGECSKNGITVSRVSLASAAFVASLAEIAILSHPNGRRPVLDIQTVIPALIWIASIIFISAATFLNDAIWKIFGSRRQFIQLVGLTTYPLYLLHSVAGVRLGHLLQLNGMATTIATIAVSVVVAGFLEPAVRRRLRWFVRLTAHKLVRQPALHADADPS
jgi:peptidoglycan/LPS O-acetylase OafA/YrhL